MLYNPTHTFETPDAARGLLQSYPLPTVEDLRTFKRSRARKTTDPSVFDEIGNRWEPIPHASILDDSSNALLSLGFTPGRTALSVTREGHAVAGIIRAEDPRAMIPGTDGAFSLEFGWLHDNMQGGSLQIVAAETVTICTNGMILGDVLIKIRHTTNVRDRMTEAIDRAALAWKGVQEKAAETIERMRSRVLSIETAHDLLVTFARRKVIGSSRILPIAEEYLSERNIAEHGERPTLWNLYNAGTEVAKAWAPTAAMRWMRDVPILTNVTERSEPITVSA
jgi:hypothetical protein